MKKPVVVLLLLAGFLFLGLAVYYWVTPAGKLPHGFPGYEAGSAHTHLKHGLAALLLAIGAWVLAWFSTGKKGVPSSSSEPQG